MDGSNELRRQWEMCFEHTRRGIAITDPATALITSVNPAFARMHGRTVRDLVGEHITSVFAPEPSRRAPSLGKEVRRTGYLAYESEDLRGDGTTFPVAVEVMTARDDSGELLFRIGWFDDISDQRAEERRRLEVEREKSLSEAELLRSRDELEEAQRVAHIGSWEWDVAGDAIHWSDELCRIFGFEPGTVPPSYEAYIECIHPDDREMVNSAVQKAYGDLQPYQFEHRIQRADGTVRTVDSRGYVVASESGEPARMLGTAQDITELQQAHRARAEAEERFRRAFDDSSIGMAIVSAQDEDEGRVLDANDAICEITGYDREALKRMSLETLSHPDDVLALRNGLRELRDGIVENFQEELRIVTGPGDDKWVALSTSLVRGADGEALHRVVQLQDVSERKRFEGQLRYLADHDALTGLFNRRRFQRDLERELATARRYETDGALLVIDLDNFKWVNDSIGHAAGDELIREVAAALKGALRATDYLARLGGDEFAVLLPHAAPAEAKAVAEKILKVVRDEVWLDTDRGPRRTTASIGVAPFGDLATRAGAEELLIEGDIAMYDAKDEGRDRVAVFEPDAKRQDAIEQRLTWSNRIREALTEERFVLHAQPIVPLGAAEEVPRAELLLRMLSDNGELIPPAAFLLVAERFGLIEEIDRWVVRRAIEIVAERERAGKPLAVEVNLSAKSISDGGLVELIESELERTGARPERLTFEVTETAAIERIDRAKEFARGLQRLGCPFAIDDFGSGFATYYYIKHLEFDYVKIDGEFIQNLPSSKTDQLVVSSVVSIAKGLSKKTIAEFVGDEATVQMLRELGVDYAQGFYVGRPGPLDELEVPAASVPAPH